MASRVRKSLTKKAHLVVVGGENHVFIFAESILSAGM